MKKLLTAFILSLVLMALVFIACIASHHDDCL